MADIATNGPGIGLGPLPAGWQPFRVAAPPIAPDFFQTLDIRLDDMTQFSFEPVLFYDLFPEAIRLFGGQILGPGVRIHLERGQNLSAGRQTDTVDVGQ